jgi:hypothetical protein
MATVVDSIEECPQCKGDAHQSFDCGDSTFTLSCGHCGYFVDTNDRFDGGYDRTEVPYPVAVVDSDPVVQGFRELENLLSLPL